MHKGFGSRNAEVGLTASGYADRRNRLSLIRAEVKRGGRRRHHETVPPHNHSRDGAVDRESQLPMGRLGFATLWAAA